MAVIMRIEMHERYVFRRHLDEAIARFGQPARKKTTLAESAGVVAIVDRSRLARQIERFPVARTQQAVGILERPQHRFMMIIARQFANGTAAQKLAITLPARLEAFARHAARRTDGKGRVLRKRDVERAECAAEESAGRE